MRKSLAISLAANVTLAAAVIILWHERAATPAATPSAHEAATSVDRLDAEADETTPGAAHASAANGKPASTAAIPVKEDDFVGSGRREQIEAMLNSAAIRHARVIEARASAKETFRDFVVYARLNSQQERRFYDLMAEYFVDTEITANADFASDAMPEQLSTPEHEFEAGLEALLGEAGAAQYREFDDAGTVTVEVAKLSRQLEGRDLPLSDDQRARLMRAVIEHRQEFVDAQIDEVFMKDFMRDPKNAEARLLDAASTAANLRLDRLESLAQPILTGEQMRSFEDLRSAQRARNEIMINTAK